MDGVAPRSGRYVANPTLTTQTHQCCFPDADNITHIVQCVNSYRYEIKRVILPLTHWHQACTGLPKQLDSARRTP